MVRLGCDPKPDDSAPPAVPKTLLPLPWAVWFWTQARKIVVSVVGFTLIAFGIAGLLLPVLPGWLTIFGGLAVLGTEFAWARWILKGAQQRAGQLVAAAQKQMTVSKNGC